MAIAVQKELSRAAIGAGGDELKFTGAVDTIVKGHGAGEYTRGGVGPGPLGRSQTPKSGRLRQPALIQSVTRQEVDSWL